MYGGGCVKRNFEHCTIMPMYCFPHFGYFYLRLVRVILADQQTNKILVIALRTELCGIRCFGLKPIIKCNNAL